MKYTELECVETFYTKLCDMDFSDRSQVYDLDAFMNNRVPWLFQEIRRLEKQLAESESSRKEFRNSFKDCERRVKRLEKKLQKFLPLT